MLLDAGASPGGWFPMKKTDTREKLLDVAARLFYEQGYAATGVATILREAEVNSGSLYYFFSSKEELLLGVLDRYVELLHPIIMGPAEAAAEDPIERIFALLNLYREGLRMTDCRLGCPIGNLALEVSDGYPEARKKIDLNFRNWSGAVRRWLEAAAPNLPADVNLDHLSEFVLTVMEGGMMQARARDNIAPFDASVAVLRDYIDRLLAEKAAAEKNQGA